MTIPSTAGFGLQSTGFVVMDYNTIVNNINADQQAAFGADFDVAPSTPNGIVTGIFASKLSALWQQLGAVYASQYPNGATSTALDQLAQLTGVRRLVATQGAVTASITGTPGTLLKDGYANTRIKNSGNASLWYMNVGPGNGSQLTIPSSSSTTAGFLAAITGAIASTAGTLTIIDTPISGWTAVTNPTDATLGAAVETDAALRVRRFNLLASQGKGTLDAILANVLQVSGVSAAVVLENYTQVTDSNNTPSHGIQCVVLGGADSNVAQAIWNAKDAGISAYGTSSATALDSISGTRVVAFTRPTQLTAYVSVTATTGSAWAGATANIANALTAYGATLGIGALGSVYPGFVVFKDLYVPVFGVGGVKDASIGISFTSLAATGTSNLAVGALQVTVWQTQNFQVTLQ